MRMEVLVKSAPINDTGNRKKAGKMNPVFERIGKYYYDNPSTHTNLQICFYITVRI